MPSLYVPRGYSTKKPGLAVYCCHGVRHKLVLILQNTNKHVRLTQDKPSQKGWLWSRMPLSVLNWQMDIEFKVDGKAHNLFGDGFAIWLSKDRAKLGSVFGSIGLCQPLRGCSGGCELTR